MGKKMRQDEDLKKDQDTKEEVLCENKTEGDEAAGEISGGGTPEEAGGASRQELEELKKQCEDNYNRFLRMQADFDNYRKRVARERDEMYYSALETIMKQILPVVDNLERAVAAFRNDGLDGKYIDGLEMVYKQLGEVLEKNGLKEIEALNLEFDPNVHHAVMQVEGTEEDENKVKEVLQKGYMLGGKVIRPTLVKVATK